MTDAEMFMKYDYAEMKDLLKTFITIVSGSIVFSLTFSDKVIKFDDSPRKSRIFVTMSWSLIIISLILAGISLLLIASAAGKIIYGEIPILNFSYWTLTVWSVALGVLAGSSYVSGLIALMLAVVLTQVTKEKPQISRSSTHIS